MSQIGNGMNGATPIAICFRAWRIGVSKHFY
jgi:hypothetical protein